MSAAKIRERTMPFIFCLTIAGKNDKIYPIIGVATGNAQGTQTIY